MFYYGNLEPLAKFLSGQSPQYRPALGWNFRVIGTAFSLASCSLGFAWAAYCSFTELLSYHNSIKAALAANAVTPLPEVPRSVTCYLVAVLLFYMMASFLVHYLIHLVKGKSQQHQPKYQLEKVAVSRDVNNNKLNNCPEPSKSGAAFQVVVAV